MVVVNQIIIVQKMKENTCLYTIMLYEQTDKIKRYIHQIKARSFLH